MRCDGCSDCHSDGSVSPSEEPTVPKRNRMTRRGLIVFAFVVTPLGWGLDKTTMKAVAASRQTPIVEAVKKVQPSVVSISSERKAASTTRWPFNAEESQRPRVNGMGSGVVVDSRGYILTNHHVVDKVQGIVVRFHDGSVVAGRVLQYDEAMDLAILKVDTDRPLTPITVGSSADLMVGETVITIGNAFGYENTVSAGIVSQLNRNVTLSDEQVYRNLIQTDASINPGNSGGPLVNINGELIGINVAVRAGAQGIGFALPIDDVKASAAEMMSTRRLAGTWHGLIATEKLTPEGAKVYLSDIQSGSGAQSAGFQKGDEIVKVGGFTVSNRLDIERGLLDAKPGKQVAVIVRRDGAEKEIPLEVQPLARSTVSTGERVWRLLGLKTTPVGAEYTAAASDKLRGGLYVQSVLPKSAAARANIARGDILVGLNVGDRHWETIHPDNVIYILKQSESVGATTIQYFIIRQNKIYPGILELTESLLTNLHR